MKEKLKEPAAIAAVVLKQKQEKPAGGVVVEMQSSE
jgi:hypothetical protein